MGEIAQLRAQQPPAAHSLLNPVRRQRFADTWGAARSGGRRHEGSDIFTPIGTPIRSTTDGIVTKIGSNRLGGKIVGIQGAGSVALLRTFEPLYAFAPVSARTGGANDWLCGQNGERENHTATFALWRVFACGGG